MWNEDEEVAQLVAKILPVVAFHQFFEGVNLVTGSLLRVAEKQVRNGTLGSD